MQRRNIVLFGIGLFTLAGLAAAEAGPLEIKVEPERASWIYEAGESVKFRVKAQQAGKSDRDYLVRYSLGPDGISTSEKTITLTSQGIVLDAGPIPEPGFVRCTVVAEIDGVPVRGTAAAAVSPGKIAPTQSEPDDFDAFWERTKNELRSIPLEAKLEPMKENDPEVLRYKVSFQNLIQPGSDRPTRIYGVLCLPRAPGRYPAVIRFPGAGVRSYAGWPEPARAGVITLEIGVHGIPIDLDDSVYEALRFGALFGNNVFNLDNAERYYYRRVYAGCLRAVDFIYSLEQFDGENCAVTGGSQGGLLALVTAALDARVKAVASMMPAYCDVTGDLHGQAGGWPRMFSTGSSFKTDPIAAKVKTTAYYDAVNFAKRLKIPCFFGWGFNDEICPPRSLFAAYNSVKAPKMLKLDLPAGHAVSQELDGAAMQWLFAQLKAATASSR